MKAEDIPMASNSADAKMEEDDDDDDDEDDEDDDMEEVS